MGEIRVTGFGRIVIAAGLCCLAASGQALLDRTVTVPVEFRPALSRDRWDTGYWVQMERSVNPGDRPRVWMYDRDGDLIVDKTEIWFPEAYHVILHSVAAVGDGTLVASVEAWKAPGDVATLLVRVKPPGKVTDAIRTDAFVAEAMVVKDGKEIWAFGGVPVRKNAPVNPDTLTRFTLDGKQLSKGLPASSYFSKEDAQAGLPAKTRSNGQRLEAHVTDQGNAVLLPQGVGFFSPLTQSWLELDAKGEAMNRLGLASPFAAGAKVDLAKDPFNPAVTRGYLAAEMAATSDGKVYAFLAGSMGLDGTGLFELDRQAGKWVSVPKAAMPAGYGGLYGSDGAQLIVRNGCCNYGWVRLDPARALAAK